MTDELSSYGNRAAAELFLRAVDMPPAIRTAFLRRTCLGITGMLDEVEGLLRAVKRPAHEADRSAEPVTQVVDSIGDALQQFFVSSSRGHQTEVRLLTTPGVGPGRPQHLAELIKLEQKWRWSIRQPKPLEAYLREWPELRATPSLLLGLLQSECLARAVYATPATPGELQLRFPELAGRIDLEVVEEWARSIEPILNPHSTIPSVIPDRFKIIRQVGEGGMGVVYEAVDQQRGARIALKTLPRMEPVPLYRFKREFRSLAGLSHPNLVSLYELISDGSVWFFTMEFIDGVDFITHCRSPVRAAAANPAELPGDATTTDSYGPRGLDETVLRDGLRQLAEGVRALHLAHIVHRDLKPSNVLVRADGHVVILDFGLAKELRSTDLVSDVPRPSRTDLVAHPGASWTQDQDVVGSVPYMSPEQAWRGDVGEASDWYSVGVMLYEALTGMWPYRGEPLEILLNKRAGGVVPPKELRAGVPDDLSDLAVALLRRQPHERPSGADVLAQLQPGRRAAPKHAGAPPPAFVGREAQVATLEAAYEELKRKVAVTVHIRGRSGAGKTALAQRYLDALPADAVVLSGRCYEQESVPFKALDSIVDALCRRLMQLPATEAAALIPSDIAALARIFPVIERVDVIRDACRGRSEIPDLRELRRRAFGALGEMFHRLGTHAPLILFIDDLQWGDVDSAALLVSFLEAPDPPRLMLLVCYRTERADANPCLIALNASRNQLASFDVEIGELSFADCVTLATILLDNRDGHASAAERIARESGGNPYLVYELVRQFESGSGSGADASPAPDLDEAFWRRVLSLPPSARHLLEIVAVAGKPLSLRSAYEATDLGSQGPSALATLRAERLVRSTGPSLDDEIETYHDRIRESVTKHVSAAATVELHRRLAFAFEAGGNADVDATAAHFRGAGMPEPAARYYALAGDKAAAALAFGRSAELYGLAIGLGHASADATRELHRKRADALANAGRGYEAGIEYQQAAVGADSPQLIELQRLAGYQYCVSGHIDEGRQAFATVLAHFNMKLPRTRREALLSLLLRRLQLRLRGLRFRERSAADVPAAELEQVDILWSVATGMTIIDPIRGAEFQTLDLILALRAGEPYRVARALAWEAAHVAMTGVRLKARADAELAAAEELADRINVPYASAMVHMSRGVAAYFHGDFRRCRQSCEEAAQIFRNRCTGVSWELETCNTFALWPSYFGGEYAELRKRFSTLIAEIRERGARLAEADITTFGGPFVWLAADDADGARRAMAGVMGEWSQQDFQVQHFTTLTAEAQIDLYLGDGRSAWQRVEREWSGVADAMLLHVEIVRAYMHHLRARCALAALDSGLDRAALLAAAARDAKRLERERPPYAKGLARMIRAGLAFHRDDRETAATLLLTAADELDRLGWGCFGTAARRQYGELIGGEAGGAIVRDVDAYLRLQGVKRPDLIAALQAPGFSSR
jgi:hypothetical protein